jgi:hypothetical protein
VRACAHVCVWVHACMRVHACVLCVELRTSDKQEHFVLLEGTQPIDSSRQRGKLVETAAQPDYKHAHYRYNTHEQSTPEDGDVTRKDTPKIQRVWCGSHFLRGRRPILSGSAVNALASQYNLQQPRSNE